MLNDINLVIERCTTKVVKSNYTSEYVNMIEQNVIEFLCQLKVDTFIYYNESKNDYLGEHRKSMLSASGKQII